MKRISLLTALSVAAIATGALSGCAPSPAEVTTEPSNSDTPREQNPSPTAEASDELGTQGFYDLCIDKATEVGQLVPSTSNFLIVPEDQAIIEKKPDGLVVMFADFSQDSSVGASERTLICAAGGPKTEPYWVEVGVSVRLSSADISRQIESLSLDAAMSGSIS